MSFKLSNRSKSRLKGINKALYLIAVNGVKECHFDFGIPQTGGLRTPEDQNKLYKQKVSRCDGYKKLSYHQSGNAFDIYAYVDRKASWNKKYYKKIANHLIRFAKREYNINLEWGGSWKNFVDLPHFEIRNLNVK